MLKLRYFQVYLKISEFQNWKRKILLNIHFQKNAFICNKMSIINHQWNNNQWNSDELTKLNYVYTYYQVKCPLVNKTAITGTGSNFRFCLTFTLYIKLEGSTLQNLIPPGRTRGKGKCDDWLRPTSFECSDFRIIYHVCYIPILYKIYMYENIW